MMKKKILTLFTAAIILLGSVLTSCASAERAVTFRDCGISEGMYSFFLSTYKSSYVSYYKSVNGKEPVWEDEFSPGVTLEEHAKELIDEKIKKLVISIQLFRDLGLGIDKSISDEIDADIAEKADFAGGVEELDKDLEKYGIDSKVLKDCYIAQEKESAVDDALFGKSGLYIATSDEVNEYYKDNYTLVKFVVIYHKNKISTNPDGTYNYGDDGKVLVEELNEDEKALKLELAKEALESAKNDTEMSETIRKYSEADSGIYTDGYFVSSNERSVFGEAFLGAVKEMTAGEVRRVEDEEAIFIIRKYDLPEYSSLASDSLEQLDGIQNYATEVKKDTFFKALYDEVVMAELTGNYSVKGAKINGKY